MKRTRKTLMLLVAAFLMLGLATVMNTAEAAISPAVTITALADREYTGEAIQPSVVINDGSYTLIAAKDYILAYSNNTNVGTATVSVAGWGTYSGIQTVDFRITAVPLPAITSVTPNTYVYTGTAREPVVAITGLTAGTDFDVTYSANTNVGTATATATGKGNYSGTQTANFTITAASLPAITSVTPSTYVYTGTACEPVVAITGLTAGTDFNVTYSANTNVGTATATATGKGNYSGTQTANFTITAASLPTVTAPGNVVYTGSAFTPDVGIGSLVKDTDYTLSYANNINKGTATVTVSGKGNYTGTAYVTFEIAAAPLPAVTAPGNVVYTGSAFTPDVGIGSLVKDTDYTLSYANNTNKGTATVTVSGKGNYTGTDNVTFEIAAAPLPALNDIGAQTYTGSQIKPAFTFAGGPTPMSSDYTVTWEDNTTVALGGKVTVTALITGNFSGSSFETFTITPKLITAPIANTPQTYDGTQKTGVAVGTGYSLTGAPTAIAAGGYTAHAVLNDAANTVWSSGGTANIPYSWTINPAALPYPAAIDDVVYTGNPFTPDVVMTNVNTGNLVKGTDYTLSYANNTNAGLASVTITGAGNYTARYTVDFAISPALLPAIAPLSGVVYTGASLTPDVVMTNVNTGNLVKDKDYTLTYANNTNVGTATVTVTGKGNYAGDSDTADFAISPALLPVIAALPGVVYTGLPFMPDVVMNNINTGNLVKDKDYTLTYANNTNAGTATVTVTGKGNYKDPKTVDFAISPALLPAIAAIPGVVYTGNTFTPDVVMVNTNPEPDVTLKITQDYTMIYGKNTDAGTATITVTGAGNYDGDIQTADFVISPALLPAIAPLPGVVYTGKPFTPDVVMVNTNPEPDFTLIIAQDYTLTYEKNTNVGTATVTVTGKGNYDGDIQTADFVISPALLPAIAPLPGVVYTGTSFTPDVVMSNVNTGNLVKDKDYTLNYANNSNAGTATVTVTGKGNYKDLKTADFVISPALLPAIAPLPSVVYTGTSFTPDVVMSNVSTGNLIKDKDYTLAYANNTNAGTATVTVTGKGNFTGTKTVGFDISAALLPVVRPLADQTYTGGLSPNFADSDSDGISDWMEAMLRGLNPASDFNASVAMEILLNTNRGGMRPALNDAGRAGALDGLAGSNFLETLFNNYQAQPGSTGLRFIPADGVGDTLTLNIAGDEAMAFKLNARDSRFFSMLGGTLLEHTRDGEGKLVLTRAMNLTLLRDKDGKPVFDYSEESETNYDTPVVMSDRAGTLFLVGSWNRLQGRVTQDLLLIDTVAFKAYRLPGSAGASHFDVAPSGGRLAYILGGKPIIIDLETAGRYAPDSQASLLGFTDRGDLIISLMGGKATIVDNDGKESRIDFEGLLNAIQPTNNHRSLVYIKGGIETPFSFTASAGIDASQGILRQRTQVVMDGLKAAVPAYNSVRLFDAEAGLGLNVEVSILKDFAS